MRARARRRCENHVPAALVQPARALRPPQHVVDLAGTLAVVVAGAAPQPVHERPGAASRNATASKRCRASRSLPTMPNRTPTSCGRSRSAATRSTSSAHSCAVQSSSTASGTQPPPRPRRQRRRAYPSSSASWVNSGPPASSRHSVDLPAPGSPVHQMSRTSGWAARQRRRGHPGLDVVGGRGGARADRFSQPSAVTRMSSSIRTPMPRNSSGTSQVVRLEVQPGLDGEDHARLEHAVEVHLLRACAQSCTSSPRWWLRAVHHPAAVLLPSSVERLLGGRPGAAPTRPAARR